MKMERKNGADQREHCADQDKNTTERVGRYLWVRSVWEGIFRESLVFWHFET